MNQSQGLIQSPSGTTATAPGHQTGGLWYTPTYCNEGAEAAAGPEPEPFEVESGTRQASCGTTHNYDLVSPSPTAETARRPVVVLLHDWGRSSFVAMPGRSERARPGHRFVPRRRGTVVNPPGHSLTCLQRWRRS